MQKRTFGKIAALVARRYSYPNDARFSDFSKKAHTTKKAYTVALATV
jgi:hypothetical protein